MARYWPRIRCLLNSPVKSSLEKMVATFDNFEYQTTFNLYFDQCSLPSIQGSYKNQLTAELLSLK